MSSRPRKSRSVEVDTSRQESLTQSRPTRLPINGRASTILRVGLRQPWHGDLYHRALTLSWPRFFAVAAVIYLVANAGFALAYLDASDQTLCLLEYREGTWRRQTLATLPRAAETQDGCRDRI